MTKSNENYPIPETPAADTGKQTVKENARDLLALPLRTALMLVSVVVALWLSGYWIDYTAAGVDRTLALSSALRLGFSLAGLVGIFTFLRWLDWLAGVKFSTMVWPVIVANPVALAIYVAGRFFACCYYFAGTLS